MVLLSDDMIPCKEVVKADSVERRRKVFGKLFISLFYGHTYLFSIYFFTFLPFFQINTRRI